MALYGFLIGFAAMTALATALDNTIAAHAYYNQVLQSCNAG
jgi:hypothetical protein